MGIFFNKNKEPEQKRGDIELLEKKRDELISQLTDMEKDDPDFEKTIHAIADLNATINAAKKADSDNLKSQSETKEHKAKTIESVAKAISAAGGIGIGILALILAYRNDVSENPVLNKGTQTILNRMLGGLKL